MKNNRKSADRIADYLAFAQDHPELFVTDPGGVRILLDRSDIERVEGQIAMTLARRALDQSGSQVGVLVRDPWIYVLRDAVEFPTGDQRLHTRIVNRVDNGVAALPFCKGRIVLLRHFRHAARRWMLEIPRGGIESGQTLEQAVRQELLEEMEARPTRIVSLGFAHGLSNLSFNGAHLHYVEIDGFGRPQLEEGIAAFEQVTVAEMESLIRAGRITDSFTLAAFLQCRLQGLL